MHIKLRMILMKSFAPTFSLLLLVSAPVFSCDWKVSRTTDEMTDVVTCAVTSGNAKISFYRHGTDRPNVYDGSAYSESHLRIRIDDKQMISMGDNAYTRQKALDELLPQLKSGTRIPINFNDYPEYKEGDAPLCNRQQLLEAC